MAVGRSAFDPEVKPPAAADRIGLLEVQASAIALRNESLEHFAVLDEQSLGPGDDRADMPFYLDFPTGGRQADHFAGNAAADGELHQRAGADKAVSGAHPFEPGVHVQPALAGVDIGPYGADQLAAMEIADRVFPPDRRHAQSVVERRVPRIEPGPAGARPLDRIGGPQRGGDHVALGAAQAGGQGIGLAAEGMHVGHRGALGLGLAEHVGVARVGAFDPGALIAGRERGDQVVAHAEHQHVTIKWRAIFLAHHHQPIGLGNGMRAAAGDEELVVQHAVVLVGRLHVDNVLVFGCRHQHQVFQRVVQVAAIVHVHVGGPAVPAFGRHVGHRLQGDRQPVGLAGADFQFRFARPVLEPFDRREAHLPDRQLDLELAAMVEQPIAGPADPGVGVDWGVELAVGGEQVNPRGDRLFRLRVDGADRQHTHRPLPLP